MTDSLKIVKKNFILAFKHDIKNFLGFLPLIYIGSLIFKNEHNDILNPLLIMSSVVSVGIVYAIVGGLMANQSTENISLVMKSLPIKQRDIVIGFYIFSAVIILSNVIAVSIFPAVKSVIEEDIIYFRSTFMINIIFCVSLFSILFPFIFKFGYSRTKSIIVLIIYVLLPLALLYYYIQTLNTEVYFISETKYIINMITNNLEATLIECIVLYLVSMAISIKAYNSDN